MRTASSLRVLVTILAVGCAVYSIFLVEPGRFPFTWRAVGPHTVVIEPRPDLVMPSGSRAGDRIDLREQDLRARASLHTATRPGESHALKLRRGDRTVTVPVTRQAIEDKPGFVGAVLLPLLLALGLITLWWGRDWAAWGLSLFALGVVLNYFLFVLPLGPVAGFTVVLLNEGLVSAMIPAGLYVSALVLAGPSLPDRLRPLFHWTLGLVLVAQAALSSARSVGFVAYGNVATVPAGVPRILYVVAILIPIAVLLAAFPRADLARRLRLRWLIWSLGLFLGALAWGNLADVSDLLHNRGTVRQTIWLSALVCGLAGLLYSVLRKRVVAMSFAINRAIVYGLVIALVVGVFAFLAALLENTAIGSDAGLALTVGVSLALGFALEALRDRLNSLIERLFFRRMHAADKALRRFARECAWIERPGRLLEEAEEEIHRHIRPRSSAFYEHDGDGYRRVRYRGEDTFPESIDVDDRAFVTMRAGPGEVRLADVRSALGDDGYVFPMTVRGELRGAIACGARVDEYTSDERELLAEVARQVGAALHALRARDNETFVKRIASGDVPPSDLVERARRLQAGWAAARGAD